MSPVEAQIELVTMAPLVFLEGKAAGMALPSPFVRAIAPPALFPLPSSLLLCDKQTSGIVHFTLNELLYPPISMSLTLDSEVLR